MNRRDPLGLRSTNLDFTDNRGSRDVYLVHLYPAKLTAQISGTLRDAISLPVAMAVNSSAVVERILWE